MTTAKLELAGRRFGRLVAIERVGKRARQYVWRCACDCGAETTIPGSRLTSGNTTSCGCALRQARCRPRSHGECRSAEYRIWTDIIQRCTNEKRAAFADYGGRGVTLCPEWRRDFVAFRDHVGPRPSARHSIDRIDNGRGYEPGNVRWATRTEQNRNRRDNLHLTVDGTTKTAAEWAQLTGIKSATIRYRLHAGWTAQQAVTTPVKRAS